MSDMFERLRAPFPIDRISWRIGPTNAEKTRGAALAYIDARDVRERLDEVCGPANWQNRYPHANSKTVCEIGIYIAERKEWVWKSDGAGDTDREAEKGALSDAFKRAAGRWGIGQYLYDIPPAWVDIEPAGKSYRIKDTEMRRLTGALGNARQAPAAEPPDGKQAFIDSRKEKIARFVDYDALGEWWNSESEGDERRKAGLDAGDIHALKQIVIEKREELQKAKRRQPSQPHRSIYEPLEEHRV
jgi:hypothetical protein